MISAPELPPIQNVQHSELLKANIDKLHLLAKYLLKFEKIDGPDFEKLMKGEITEADIEAEANAEPEIKTEASDNENTETKSEE